MDEKRFFALLRVDIKRGTRPTVKGLAMVAVVIVVLVFTGNASGEKLGLVLVGTSMMYVMTVPLMTFKDKMDGSLEFLTTLPVSGSVVASARLAATCLATLPAAVQAAFAFGLFAAPVLGVSAVGPSIFYSGFLVWVAFALASFFCVALFIRFETSQVFLAPFFLMFAVIFGGEWLVSRLFEDPLASMRAFVAMPLAPYIVAGLLAVGLITLLAVSFVLAKQGIERYHPTRDAIEW